MIIFGPMGSVHTLEKLKDILRRSGTELSPEQESWFARDAKAGSVLPFRVTESFLRTAVSAGEEAGALLKQVIPDSREFEVMEYELDDPLGEKKFSPLPGLVHRYPDRVLILATDQCAMFCRHCFRRSFSGGDAGPVTEDKLAGIIGYLQKHRQISEVLLSGGDPLTLSEERLCGMVGRIKRARPDLVIRLCSRIPVSAPERVTETLVSGLSGFGGLWFVTQINHPAELSADAVEALTRLRKGGIPVLTQTVLLRGVNDSLQTLSQLFRSLLQAGVKPYYIFQGDLAAGTSHLRLPLGESLELVSKLRPHVSGIAMPRFAVDLPGGGGKISLPPAEALRPRPDGYYYFKGPGNEEYRYPAY